MLFSGGTVVQRIQAFQFHMDFPGKGEWPYHKLVIYYVGLRNFNFYSFLFLSLFFIIIKGPKKLYLSKIVHRYNDYIYYDRCIHQKC